MKRVTEAPTVDADYQGAVRARWSGVPEGRFVGNSSVFPHDQVLFVASLIDSSGIAGTIDRWQAEDSAAAGKHPGGRPRTVSTRTALTLMFLLTMEHSSQLIEELAYVAFTRLSPESAVYLGLGGDAGQSKGEARTKQQWYFPIYRSMKRTLDTIDPKPHTSTKKGHFPTVQEVEEMKERWAEDDLTVKQIRLDRVTNDLLQATIDLVPEEYERHWQGDTVIDATVVPAFGKRGAPYGGKRGASDPSAGWYRRDYKHNTVEDGSKTRLKRAVFGWDLTVVIQTNHEPDEQPKFPMLITGIGMTVPAKDLIRTGTDIYVDMARRDLPPGRVTGDRGYGASAVAGDWQLPLRALGHRLVMDYKDAQLGTGSGEEYEGARQVEGAWYCPSMPDDLVNATIQMRAGEIDKKTWRLRIAKRRAYMLRPKEKPDANGSVAMMCPAKGPGATARCPLAESCGAPPVTGDKTVTIYDPPDKEHAGLVCTNKRSVNIPITAGAKLAQDGYGSDRWSREYTVDRAGIEAANAYVKDGSKEALEVPTRRRLRGYAAQYLLISFSMATANLRRIQAFRDKELLAASAANYAELRKRNGNIRERRSLRSDRVAPWGDFKWGEPDDVSASKAGTSAKRKSTPKRVPSPVAP
jgi:hypothetical protein